MSTDRIDKTISGIQDVLSSNIATTGATCDLIRTLIEHGSSSLEIIDGIQTSVRNAEKHKRKPSRSWRTLLNAKQREDGEVDAQHELILVRLTERRRFEA